MSSYEHVVKGKLSLKGGALPVVGGVKKKKKKSKNKDKEVEEAPLELALEAHEEGAEGEDGETPRTEYRPDTRTGKGLLMFDVGLAAAGHTISCS